jgi:outer membrane protein assembly factor BamA
MNKAVKTYNPRVRDAAMLPVMLFFVIALAALSSCSTTRRLANDETLYTGVQKVDITSTVPAEVRDKVKEAVDVSPNTFSLFGIDVPIPVGLWVYNNWNPDSHGLKKWMYNKLVQEPVTVSDVRPNLRTTMIESLLDNSGYFRGKASYELIPSRKNSRKAKIRYVINPGDAYLLDTIELLPDTTLLCHKIDSVARRSAYLLPGQRYSTDSLSAERTRIANELRNSGYYFFRPEYIEYLADSTIHSHSIALRLSLARNTPEFALKCYTTGNITIYVNRNEGGGTPDTIPTRRGTIIQMKPSKLRSALIPECVTFRQGRPFSVRDVNRTQTYLSRLGIFNSINIEAVPDTASSEPKLNVDVTCTFEAPLEASIEANLSSKSNSYLGPGATLSLTHRNLWGGGEQFRVDLTGSYEWQTGSNRSSVFNSYEAGVNTSLAVPRLLMPHFVRLSRKNINWTRFQLNADLLNRPHYFNMAQFTASMAYDWQTRRYFSYSFTPLKLTYVKLMRTTATFDSIMARNIAVAQSFRNQFIPQMLWSMNYEHYMNRDNLITVTTTFQEAGNIAWLLWRAAGVTGEKRLFSMPFSQFVRGTAQVVYSHRVNTADNWFVSRFLIGAAHAYGNGSEVPYSEQFYVGGANSVRAFSVRSIGPGSYHPGSDDVNNNFDQTGTFKLEFNMEYRFALYGPLHGALFVDTGNVWLLKGDAQRPGGTLRASTFLKEVAVGTGVGLRFDMGMMVLRGDLGIGIHAPYYTGHGGYYNMTSFGNSLAFHLAIGYPF